MAPVICSKGRHTQKGNQHFHSLLWPASHSFSLLKTPGFPRSSTPRRRSGSLCLGPALRPEGFLPANRARLVLTPAAAAVPRLAHVLGHLVTLVEPTAVGVAQAMAADRKGEKGCG